MLSVVILALSLSICVLLGAIKFYRGQNIVIWFIMTVVVCSIPIGLAQIDITHLHDSIYNISPYLLITFLVSLFTMMMWYGGSSVEIIMIASIVGSFVSLSDILGSFAGHHVLLAFYLLIEVQSLSMCIMLGFGSKQGAKYSEGAIKVYIMNAIGSVWLLMGIAYWFIEHSVLSFADAPISSLGHFLTDNQMAYGEIFILFGLLLKLGMVPFHLWTLDCYTSVSYKLIATIATLPKLTILALLSYYGDIMPMIIKCIAAFGVIAVIVGSIALSVQQCMKRFMVYSGIINIGYVCLYMYATDDNSLFLPMLHVLCYLVSIIPLGLYFDKLNIKVIDDLIGYGRMRIKDGAIISISILSLAGFPPMLCFISKFMMVYDILLSISKRTVSHELNLSESFISVFIILIGAALALYGYLKLLYIMYQEPKKAIANH